MLKEKLDSFLDITLTKAGFNPDEDNFDMLKEEMLPILEEFLELKLYEALEDSKKSEYDKTTEFDISYFENNLPNFNAKFEKLCTQWQNNYLKAFSED